MEKKGQTQDHWKVELLDLVHPSSGLGSWPTDAYTHQGREPREGRPWSYVCSAGETRK